MWHNTSWLSNLVGRDLGPWQLYPFSSCWLSYVIISGSLVKSLSVRQLQCPSVHRAFICCLPQFKTECFIFRIKVLFTVLHFPTRPRAGLTCIHQYTTNSTIPSLGCIPCCLTDAPPSLPFVFLPSRHMSLGQVQCCYLGTLCDCLLCWLFSFSLLDFAVLEDITKE